MPTPGSTCGTVPPTATYRLATAEPSQPVSGSLMMTEYVAQTGFIGRSLAPGFRIRPREYDLPAAARVHDREALLKLGEGQAVGDHRRDVQPTLEHYGHLVPGLVHLA